MSNEKAGGVLQQALVREVFVVFYLSGVQTFLNHQQPFDLSFFYRYDTTRFKTKCDWSCPVISVDNSNGNTGMYFNVKMSCTGVTAETTYPSVQHTRGIESVWSGTTVLWNSMQGGSGDADSHGRRNSGHATHQFLDGDYVSSPAGCVPWHFDLYDCQRVQAKTTDCSVDATKGKPSELMLHACRNKFCFKDGELGGTTTAADWETCEKCWDEWTTVQSLSLLLLFLFLLSTIFRCVFAF